jgi:methylsterol monooxygenase
MTTGPALAVQPDSGIHCVLHGLVQGVVGALLLPPTLQVWAYVTSLYYDTVQARWGLEAAVFTVSAASMLVFLLVAVALTIPTLVGQKQGKIQEHKGTSAREVLRLVPLVALNFCISVVVLAGLCLAATPRERLASLTADLPGWPSLWVHALICFIGGDIWCFYVHRLLHRPGWYDMVHKLHHSWTAPVALEATYQHPLELVVMQLGGCMVGSVLLGALSGEGLQAAVMLCWTTMGFIEAAAGHSGFWGLDMGLHDLHHERFMCNFSISGLPDLLYGTLRVRRRSPAAALDKYE